MSHYQEKSPEELINSQAPTQTWSSGARRADRCSFWCLAVGSSGHMVWSHRSTGHHGSPGPCGHIWQDTGRRCKQFMQFLFCRGNAQAWLIPRSTLPPPTVDHRQGFCRAVSLRAAPGRPWCRAHCRPSCPDPVTASSNIELDETGNPPHRFLSTRSSCSPPTWARAGRNLKHFSWCAFFFFFWLLPGLTFSADAEVVDRLRPGQCIAVHVMDLNAVVADACDEGLWDAWTATANRHLCLTLTANESERAADRESEQNQKTWTIAALSLLFYSAIHFKIGIQFHTFTCNR